MSMGYRVYNKYIMTRYLTLAQDNPSLCYKLPKNKEIMYLMDIHIYLYYIPREHK